MLELSRRATAFVGDFSHGQTSSAEMKGEAAEMDPPSGRATTKSPTRDPQRRGAGGYFSGDAQATGALTFIQTRPQRTLASAFPLRHVGAPGAVKICAK